MYFWGQLLEPGNLVEIHGELALGFLIQRDVEHTYLWKVLIHEKIHYYHSSRLRRIS